MSFIGLAGCLGATAGAVLLNAGNAPLAGPLGMLAFGSLLGNVSGNLATDFLKQLRLSAIDRWWKGWRQLEQNDHVPRAIRRAQMKATEFLLAEWRVAYQNEFDFSRRDQDDAFALALERYCALEETDAAICARLTEPFASDAQCLHLTDELRGTFEAALAAGAAGQSVTRNERFRIAILKAVLQETIVGVQDHCSLPIGAGPPSFRSMFLDVGPSGWFAYFLRAIGEEFQKNGEFKSLWDSSQIALIRIVVEETHQSVEDITSTVSVLSDRLSRWSSALDVMRGDAAATHDATQLLVSRFIDNNAIPLELPEDRELAGFLRFSFRNPRIPFVGRKEDMQTLAAFLSSEHRFSWWLMTGAGGTGKSRLARQLCLVSAQLGWRTGFLARGYVADVTSLHAWNPSRPTLIVIDYVNSRAEAANLLVATLAKQDQARQIAVPVRILLIEREKDFAFDQGFLNEDKSILLASTYKPKANEVFQPLSLAPLATDAVWSLIVRTPWRTPPVPLRISMREFFMRLRRLDTHQRALVGLILADAIAEDPSHIASGTLEHQLRDLIQRDRDRVWPKLLNSRNKPIVPLLRGRL